MENKGDSGENNESGERICPACQQSFDTGLFCPEDGARLLVAAQGRAARSGQIIDGKFTVLGMLGEGGRGQVYRVQQHSMDREVALKLLHKSASDSPDAITRFLREAKNASKLNHPNIITLFEFGQTPEGQLYLVMEVLEGKTLSQLMFTDQQFNAQRSVNILCQVCDALQHAHDMGVIHRDIKPDNVFVLKGAGQTGEFVKVLDYGIAKFQDLEESETVTKAGIICGTPAYMSPEQVTGKELDGRSDLYSLGIVLYEMLCGQLPFVEDSHVQQLMAQVQAEPKWLRETNPDVEIPAALERLVMQLLSKSPDHRPESAAETKRLALNALEGRLSQPSIKTLDSDAFFDAIEAVNPEPVHLTPAEEQSLVHAQTGIMLTPLNTSNDAVSLLRSTDPLPEKGRWRMGPIGWSGLGVLGVLTVFLALGGSRLFEDVPNEPTRPSPIFVDAPTPPKKEASGKRSSESPHPLPGKPSTPPEKPVVESKTQAPTATTDHSDAGKEKATTVNQENPPAKSEANRDTVRIATVPPGAQVTVNGTHLGRTPLNIARPEENTTRTIRLRLRGFAPKSIDITATTEATLSILLTKPKPRKRRVKGKKSPIIID